MSALRTSAMDDLVDALNRTELQRHSKSISDMSQELTHAVAAINDLKEQQKRLEDKIDLLLKMLNPMPVT